jgi:hypothetical protein
MKARYLLTMCVILITLSIFVIPDTVKIGIDNGVATALSTLLLLGGIISAALTVDQDAREGKEAVEKGGRR